MLSPRHWPNRVFKNNLLSVFKGQCLFFTEPLTHYGILFERVYNFSCILQSNNGSFNRLENNDYDRFVIGFESVQYQSFSLSPRHTVLYSNINSSRLINTKYNMMQGNNSCQHCTSRAMIIDRYFK